MHTYMCVHTDIHTEIYLNLGLSFVTTAISISLGLKSAESTCDSAVMATCKGCQDDQS